MRWIFWGAAAVVIYTYAGYPLWLWLRCRWRARLVRKSSVWPSVSIVLAVHNEGAVLANKLRNVLALDYPTERCEIVVASDGSTDLTNRVIEEHLSNRLRASILPERVGKAAALNRAIQLARGEIIVFTDARQLIEPAAVKRLCANFADPSVGCVSGELMLGTPGARESAEGSGLYWKFEKLIRRLEGASGSVVGATGALYAARRGLLPLLPAGTLLDDVYIPLHIARLGQRVVFESQARAWDAVADSPREFRRKVRTLTGNYQLLQLAPWLLSRKNPLRFEFVSHKLLRLLVPFALLAMFFSSLLIPGAFYRAAAALQILFYASAFVAALRPPLGTLARVAEASLAFVVLNTAAAVALVYFVSGKKGVWAR